MKFIIALSAIVFSLSVHAQSSEYACKFSEKLQAGHDYEDSSDFLFKDYPYLIINRSEGKITDISVGANPYELQEEYKFAEVQSEKGLEIRVLQHISVGNDGVIYDYNILTVVFPPDAPNTAIVLSFDGELGGPVAKFDQCQ